jgi:putative PIN family toxin of toxin-antitoxin system
MLRVVLDTNLFVSSLLVKSGLPAKAIDAWRERKYLLITSPVLIAEIVNTLSYERIRRKYLITDEDVRQLISLLEEDALIVPGQIEISEVIPNDPDDEQVLICAIEGRADLIVSGDHHLLELEEYKGISIVTARQFLEKLSP